MLICIDGAVIRISLYGELWSWKINILILILILIVSIAEFGSACKPSRIRNTGAGYNVLHAKMSSISRETVSLSQDEDADNRTERTWGNIELRTRYSHVDLIHMIGGADIERGTVTRDGCTTGFEFFPSFQQFFSRTVPLFWPLFKDLYVFGPPGSVSQRYGSRPDPSII
jgi:hypothetical protein